MPEQIILIGASVRAAAQSAVRGGFTPWCADLFADRDLAAIAPASRIRRYPAGLVAALVDAPAAAVIYTGALENYPRLIEAIASRRPLWGNRGDVLRAIRNPLRVAEALRRAGLSSLKVTCLPDGLPRNGTWLCKPLRSGGGWRIAVWDEAAIDPHELPHGASAGSSRRRGGCYFQQRVEGLNCSALFVAAAGESRLLGVTRQLVGVNWTGAGPFSYAGSIGPLSLPTQQLATMRKVGDCLAAEFSLTGLFGVDAIINDAGVWPLEVNPRYPASAEVLERARKFSAIQLHSEACTQNRLPSNDLSPPRCIAGKAILFGPRQQLVPEQLIHWADEQNATATWPAVADIPQIHGLLAPGAPVLTVLAEAADEQQVEDLLRRRIATAKSLLSS